MTNFSIFLYPCYATQGSCSWSRSELLPVNKKVFVRSSVEEYLSMAIPEAWSGTKIWSSEIRISVLCSWRFLPGRVLIEEAEPLGEASGGPGGLRLHEIHTGLGHNCSGGEGSLAGLWRDGGLQIIQEEKETKKKWKVKKREKKWWLVVKSPLDHYFQFSCWCSPYWHWRNPDSRQRLCPSEIPGNCWHQETSPRQRSSSWWRGRSSSNCWHCSHCVTTHLAGEREREREVRREVK